MVDSARTLAMHLKEVLEKHRVVVTCGSGGVGKTTTAAAIAVQAALSGKRVLCLTVDPARRLANSLGLDQMSRNEQPVSKALFEQNGLTCSGELVAMMVDTKATFDDLVLKYASSKVIADRILGNEIYRYVSTSLAGTQEYMAMEKLYEVKNDPRFDFIVLDTPPTANALDFLEAPERMVAAIDSPAIRWFMDAFSSELGFGILGKGAGMLLRALGRFTGAGFLEQVAEFVSGLNDLFGGFRTRAAAVSEVFRSSDVAFVMVSSSAPAAIDEARFLSERLRELGMKRAALVINGVHPVEPSASASDEQFRAAFPGAPDGLWTKMLAAFAAEQAIGIADAEQVDRARLVFADANLSVVVVPTLGRDVHDLQALSEVAAYLVG